MSFKILALAWGLVITLCLAIGCGGNRAQYDAVRLTGAVTVDGHPVGSGKVMIIPTSKEQGSGTTGQIVAGKYEVENVPLGQVIVTFDARRETGKTYFSQQAKSELPLLESAIPEKYGMGIPLTVTKQMSSHDFTLRSHGVD